ncbi:hypothetical protein FISHEDRAFT_59723 [Fistulina hepatica ATCC 64428]|uniref:Uncharacterized protein n=1 Tax=Fistulina hepatica ATCC 64428 TaxID=1128425 RepID=A0A0D7A8M8_9AGAR|nr:hypothetical protein FISHEDRAFT_59723 [Fistulina hepatica ATCC 64428]
MDHTPSNAGDHQWMKRRSTQWQVFGRYNTMVPVILSLACAVVNIAVVNVTTSSIVPVQVTNATAIVALFFGIGSALLHDPRSSVAAAKRGTIVSGQVVDHAIAVIMAWTELINVITAINSTLQSPSADDEVKAAVFSQKEKVHNFVNRFEHFFVWRSSKLLTAIHKANRNNRQVIPGSIEYEEELTRYQSSLAHRALAIRDTIFAAASTAIDATTRSLHDSFRGSEPPSQPEGSE